MDQSQVQSGFFSESLIKWIMPIGILSNSLTFGIMFSSPEFTGAGIATVLGSASPLIIIVLAALFLSEKITIVKITSLILGITGIIFIFVNILTSENTGAFSGAVFATGTSTGIAVTAILLKRLKPGTDLISFTGWQLIAGGLLLLTGSFFFEPSNSGIWSGFFIGLVIFLVVIGTAFTEISWFWLLQKYDAGRLSLYLLLTTVSGLLIAFDAFGETLKTFDVIGIIIVTIALGLTVYNEFKSNHSQ